MTARGATPAEWYHFDLELGLAGNLLPVVCDPDPPVAPGSKIRKWGKVPSAYNAQGQAHGIKDWQTRELLPNELQLWRQDPRLGICVRTGSLSHVYAIDVDVDDQALADRIRHEIFFLGEGYRRTRANSPKFLVPIALEGILKKRVIETKHGKIEFLGEGQQYLACGTHPSGVRYEWVPGLPERIPALSVEQFETLWGTLAGTFGKETSVVATLRHAQTDQISASGDNTLLTSIDDETRTRLASALAHPKMLAAGTDNGFWSEIGYALLTLGQIGKDLFHDYSRQAPNFEPAASDDWWDSHQTQETRTDYRHCFTLARKFGWGAVAGTESFPLAGESAALRQNAESAESDPLDIEDAPLPARPVVRLIAGEYPSIARQVTGIVASEVYKQSGALVRIGRPDDLADGITRDADTRSILQVSSSYMRSLAGDSADFVAYDGRAKDWVRKDCPPDLARDILTMGDWPNVRPLDAIARAPFVRINGTACDVPGYDAPSRVFYMPNANFPRLPLTVSRSEALIALATLLNPFQEFPYATPAARSAFVAHILTEAVRPAIRTSPMYWFTAPDAGTGKTLLAEMPSAIVHGVQPAVRPWVSDSDELRKTLFASLVAGDRSIMFDNVPTAHKVRTAELCAFITSPVWKDRRLGASEMVEVPNRAVLSATGNNITPVADMARRSLVVRLDANSADRKQRRFKIADLPTYVKEHRVELLIAALTVVLGWQQNKSGVLDEMPIALPSFEDWSSMVRDPLLWLGMPDPVQSQEEETDDECNAVERAFAALGAHFAGRNFTSTAVVDYCMGFSDTDGSVNQMLLEAGCQAPYDKTKVGYWLRDCRDKIAAGYKLRSLRSGGKHQTRWLLQPTNTSEDLI
jgi:hypothetical protein